MDKEQQPARRRILTFTRLILALLMWLVPDKLLAFLMELVPDKRPNRGQVLWMIRIAILLVVLFGILALGQRLYGIPVLNLMQLALTASIPVVIAVVGNRYTQQHAQDDALQSYLDHMTELLTDKVQPLHETPPGNRLRTVARARTLTVLQRLDGGRKGRVVQFLYEAELITEGAIIVDLGGADLRGADLSSANLTKASLRGVTLTRADLSFASLNGADFVGADLSYANLTMTNLVGAYLWGAKLTWLNLRHANLSNADFSEWQALRCRSLAGATVPNGQKYEDWLKTPEGQEWLRFKESRGTFELEVPEGQDWHRYKEGRGEDGENAHPS